MPLIGGNMYFSYDGKSSKEFGLIAVQIGNGMYEDTFVSPRSLIEVKMKNQDESILQRIEEDVREFPLSIAFENKFTDSDVDKVILWLFKDSYKPFFFEGQTRIQYAIPSGDSSIIHNGLKQGYVTLTMRTNSSKIYSPKKTTAVETVTTTAKTITYTNSGHVEVLPEISIVKNGAGNLTIQNLDDGGNIFEVSKLAHGEDIYLDSKREIIETDIAGVYHYDDTLGEYPKLVVGTNRWKITGACTISIRYSEKYKF